MPGYVNSLYSVTLTFVDADGTAIDVSSYAMGIEVYRQGGASYVYALTEGAANGIDDTNQATGIMVAALTPAQMTEIGPGIMRWLVYRNYATDSTRVMLASGSELIESLGNDAGGGTKTLRLVPAVSNLRIKVA